jgi:acyl transferase domain-containing protein
MKRKKNQNHIALQEVTVSPNKETPNFSEPIAIVGMSCMFADATDLKGYWRLLRRGEDAIGEVPETHWSAAHYFDPNPKAPDHVYCTRGGFLAPVDFDPIEFGIPPTVIEATDTSQLLGLVAAAQALEDAGYGPSQKIFDRSRASVIIGVTGTQELVLPLSARLGHPIWRQALQEARVPDAQADEVVRRISEAYVPWQENSFPGLLGNVVAGRIANRLDLGGTNCVVDAACASSFSAVNLGMLELAAGRSDMVITGGVDTLNDIFMHMCFAKTQVLSVSGDARPFSADADGTVLGEGIGLVVLKRLADAESDGDRIYAVIRAMGTSSDGKAQSIYAPRAEGQMRALDRAYTDAGVGPDTVELIEAHGTGTRVGDAVEFNALRTFFDRNHAPAGDCAIGSVKSMIGHTKAAAGAAGLIKATLALYHKVLPPTLKAETPDPDLNISSSPFYLNAESRPWLSRPDHPRRCGVSAFGFGGSNFHLVLEEFESKNTEAAWDGSVDIAAFSAGTHGALATAVDSLIEAVEADSKTIVQKTAATRLSFSRDDACRLVVVLEKGEDPVSILKAARKRLDENPSDQSWQNKHAWFGSGPVSGGLALVFPGQGSQYVGMGRELACCFPEFMASLEKAESVFDARPRLCDHIFPLPVPANADQKENEARLRATDVAQPAIGAVSIGMMRILERFDIRPDALAGHSYGELTALHEAGRLGTDAFFAASVARGRCMAEAGRGKESGTMLAVRAPLRAIDEWIASENIDVVLANRNNPTQGVLSGSVAAIERAADIFRENGTRTVRLPVAAAFHSPLVASALKPFKDHLSRISMAPGHIPVYANTTATPYPADATAARELLANQMVNPVNFSGIVENLFSSGIRTFVEVGPKPVLTGLIRATLKNRPVAMAAVDAGSGRGSAIADLARVLALLAAEGHPVNLAAWDMPSEQAQRPKMLVPLNGSNYRARQQAGKKTPPAPRTRQRTETIAAPPNPSGPEKHRAQTPAPRVTAAKTMEAAAKPDNPAPQWTTGALQTVQAGLRSMQDLQNKTAQAHEKFLETQAQAGQSLQQMMQSIGMLLGQGTIPAPVPLPAAPLSHPPSVPGTAGIPEPDPVPAVKTPPTETAVTDTGTPSPDRGVNETNLIDTLMTVVGRLTGYPREMLLPEMDMEADLGIDSIKRVEILSTLEEEMPDLPSVSPEMLGEMKTLGEIVACLVDQAPVKPGSMPSQPQPSPASGTADTAGIDTTLSAVVAELTGYPPEMLTPEMDLEADLGIDSIKRVEILSALEERLPDLPAVSPETMAELKTLGQIIAFLGKPSPGTEAGDSALPPGKADGSTVRHALQDVIGELTGYPPEMLTPEMDLEADLGIDSIKRVEILSALEERLPDLPAVSPEMMAELKTLGQIADFLSGSEASPVQDESPGMAVQEIRDAHGLPDPEHPLARKEIHVAPSPPLSQTRCMVSRDKPVLVFCGDNSLAEALCDGLSARDLSVRRLGLDDIASAARGEVPLPAPSGVILMAGPDLDVDRALAAAFDLARLTGTALKTTGDSGHAFFTTITRLDGAFGFLGGAIGEPRTGALAGLAKTADLEWPSVVCRALDIFPDWSSASEIAEAVIREILYADPGSPVEIGLSPGERFSLVLSDAETTKNTLNLEAGDVVVVSGGGRGVTAAAAMALAGQVHPSLVLLGRSPLPEPESEWLEGINDPAEMKRALLENGFEGRTPRPKDLEKAYRKVQSGREIHRTLEQLSSLGIDAQYHSLDIRDPEDVERCIDGVRRSLGPVRALIHGAGVLCDRLIVDKAPEQYRAVYDTKVKGLANLLSATAQDPLKHLILFSSVAARFGNVGQSDYAMANEALNKMALALARQRENCRVRSINWGPWAGGMVTDALKRQFEKRGIDLIALDAGAQAMVDEMAASGPVEIVIGGGLVPAAASPAAPPAADAFSTAVTHTVDLTRYPILDDHRLKGRPVVPLALIAEWMAHGALHDNPGLSLAGLDNLRLLRGIKMDQDRKTFHFMAAKATGEKGRFHVPVEIRGTDNGSSQIHARATAILGDAPLAPVSTTPFRGVGRRPYSRSIEDAYETVLFHGRTLHGIEKIFGCCEKGMQAVVRTAPLPSEWITTPLRTRWIADPLVFDSAFQMAILWSEEIRGVRCLPSFIGGYRQYCKRFPRETVNVALRIERATGSLLTGDFLVTDAAETVIAALVGFEAVMDPALAEAFKPRCAA